MNQYYLSVNSYNCVVECYYILCHNYNIVMTFDSFKVLEMKPLRFSNLMQWIALSSPF